MGVKLVPMKKEHLEAILNEDQNVHLTKIMPENQCQYLESTGLNYSMLRISDGKPLVCGGVTLYWKDRGEAWSIFTKDCKKEFVSIFRLANKFLDEVPVRRVEAAIEEGFDIGHRWIKLLKFTLDAPLLKKYYAHGTNVSLYSRVRE